MSLHDTYPALADLRARARRRLPKFVWEYLDSATGEEKTKARNRAELDKILFTPSILHGEFSPKLSVTLLNQKFALPIGIAPVGMSGLIWPNAESLLARTAERWAIPYALSTVASQTPEMIEPSVGEMGWFQLYPPRVVEVRLDTLKRARDAGFSTLVLTADVPVASRRERQVRSGVTMPPRLTPRLMAQIASRPAWALGTAYRGIPRMRLIEEYAEDKTSKSSVSHAGYSLRTSPDLAYLHWLREHWKGPLVVKGIMNPLDVSALEKAGVDAIWVSNHAGRQFDAAAASIEVLPLIRAQTNLPIIIDSGFETGLDILRALALGADLVMLGRAFHYAVAALGGAGPDHLVEILRMDLIANMGQLGARNFDDLSEKLIV
ncbi:alpha-hydroxy acid oxidase [Shimia abyssi]|uniref:L-lactate dehydrogenase (Cytochrome) n=1 Tax=Shimia abyssi TaxID=1662395 RepID=A0A2P8FKW2_9RHOB|nr:alpha-hydroxy acid oxidase [Shimia abyssi]PSL22342.1 L-lactate dehydrogenase (cytochrome) [Shimia abyssi]